MKKTVFVGLSGGVDSSVAALRLIQDGYNVVGVFIKVWHPEWLVCNWQQERLDAMRVAAHLNIPFLTCDASSEYKDEVAEYFIESYRNGVTPNPDVMCNKAVKFGAFLRFALERKADYVSTGHYARRVETSAGIKLLRGTDTEKDQSYFLWTLNQDQLKHILLPVGDTIKSKIRKEAQDANIPTAAKKDSQGVCFLGHIDIPEFLSHYIELKSGPVLNSNGNIVGEHQGAFVYTLGQRHGFTLNNDESERTPHYVVSKNIKANTITVASEPLQTTFDTRIKLTSCNWISTKPSEEVSAQFRYRQKPFDVSVNITDKSTFVTPVVMTEIPAIGQSCVLYRGEECLGGGMIG